MTSSERDTSALRVKLSPVRLATRIGLFSALVYVFSWVTIYLPNISLIFFIVFSAGYLWGRVPGLLVGIIGMGVWTTFNPYGPAHFYIMLVQLLGASISGLLGAAFRGGAVEEKLSGALRFKLALSGGACALLYFLPVMTVDAWLFGPFWPRLIGGLPWVAFSIMANIMIFPMLFGVTQRIKMREGDNG
jgi:hypothetical protein